MECPVIDCEGVIIMCSCTAPATLLCNHQVSDHLQAGHTLSPMPYVQVINSLKNSLENCRQQEKNIIQQSNEIHNKLQKVVSNELEKLKRTRQEIKCLIHSIYRSRKSFRETFSRSVKIPPQVKLVEELVQKPEEF